MKDTPLNRLIVFVVVGLGFWYGFGWWTEHKVVGDAVERYDMVKRANDLRGTCYAAESVVAAQLYHKREDEWKRWKEIAAQDCRLFR